MAMVTYEPWDLLQNFQRDVNRLLTQNPSRGDDDNSTVATSQWAPAVDIKEEDERFVIHADVPGVDPKEIEITMDRGVLTLKGTRNRTETDEHKGYARVERVHGSFYRRFSLPESADAEHISATGSNGVLEIVIPKREKAQPKRISVQ